MIKPAYGLQQYEARRMKQAITFADAIGTVATIFRGVSTVTTARIVGTA